MAKSWTATDVRMKWISVLTDSGDVFDSSASANLCLEGDYCFEDSEGQAISELPLKRFLESSVMGDLPIDVQAAIQTLHDYYATQARADEGM